MAQKKGSRWFADWRDINGRRLRKSFVSKRSAEQHERKMREQRDALQTLKAAGYLVSLPPKKQPKGTSSPATSSRKQRKVS